MPLAAGSRLGPYEIRALLGAGGMGEVWRATDTKLGRDVAVKILPDSFANDPDRLARFTREAQVLASLNHPNIAAIHGVEEHALVMELVEGPTLAERIARGPIPVDEALAIARQIAEALEYAHERGIVHRDLKPANIKVTPEDRVKVLDFGLAKAMSTEPAISADPAASPTLTMRATMAGVIMGTAAYMAPEQARGQVVDKRADIWSFGVVLFEMLTARNTFGGETISDTLAAVLKTDPDWSKLPADTPPVIRALLRRCLERDRRKRLRDIGDAFVDPIEEASAAAPVAVESIPRGRPYAWMAAMAVLALALAAVAYSHFREPISPSIESSLLPPEKAAFTPVGGQAGGTAISPDGRVLAFIGTQEGRTMLWVRRLDSTSAQPLAGTENAYYPFWSPDSRQLGFFASNQLKKVEVAGGPPQVICDSTLGRGGTWSREGMIVFSGIDRGLYRVPATGGRPVKLTALDPAHNENAHYWPEFLPDGKHFLYLARSGIMALSAICVGSVDDKPESRRRVEVLRARSSVRYVPPPESSFGRDHRGSLLFLRGTTLFAQRFDAAAMRVEGDATAVAQQVGFIANIAFANFSASQNGLLLIRHDGTQNNRLAWTDRDGKESPVGEQAGAYLGPSLSPDATRVAVPMTDANTGNLDIWQIDLAHGVTSRFTFDPGVDLSPVWSPDGKQIAYRSAREGRNILYRKPSRGAAGDERITPQSDPNGQADYACDWSRDGKYILYVKLGQGTGTDLWVQPLTGDRKPFPFLQTQFNETVGQFSPDTKWVAYSSDESGRQEIYVGSFPGASAKFQISNTGGVEPHWRADGKELYYISPDSKLMAVAVRAAGDTFERETPKALFEAHWQPGNLLFYGYDVTPDGRRFIGPVAPEASATLPMTLITNWQRRIP